MNKIMKGKFELAEARKKAIEHQKEFHRGNNVMTFWCGGYLWYFCPAAYCWGGCGKVYGEHNHETKTPIRNGDEDDRWFIKY